MNSASSVGAVAHTCGRGWLDRTLTPACVQTGTRGARGFCASSVEYCGADTQPRHAWSPAPRCCCCARSTEMHKSTCLHGRFSESCLLQHLSLCVYFWLEHAHVRQVTVLLRIVNPVSVEAREHEQRSSKHARGATHPTMNLSGQMKPVSAKLGIVCSRRSFLSNNTTKRTLAAPRASMISPSVLRVSPLSTMSSQITMWRPVGSAERSFVILTRPDDFVALP